MCQREWKSNKKRNNNKKSSKKVAEKQKVKWTHKKQSENGVDTQQPFHLHKNCMQILEYWRFIIGFFSDSFQSFSQSSNIVVDANEGHKMLLFSLAVCCQTKQRTPGTTTKIRLFTDCWRRDAQMVICLVVLWIL